MKQKIETHVFTKEPVSRIGDSLDDVTKVHVKLEIYQDHTGETWAVATTPKESGLASNMRSLIRSGLTRYESTEVDGWDAWAIQGKENIAQAQNLLEIFFPDMLVTYQDGTDGSKTYSSKIGSGEPESEVKVV